MFLWVNVLNSCHFPPLRLLRIYVGWSDSWSRFVIRFVLRGGLKGRAESVIRGLKVDFIESNGTSAIGLTGLLLMNKYKGLNVPRGKTPDPVQDHHNKVLFSPTLTLPYAGTFALPSAPWKCGVLSLSTPVTVFSPPAPSEKTWGVLTYSQPFWDRCCFLPDL